MIFKIDENTQESSIVFGSTYIWFWSNFITDEYGAFQTGWITSNAHVYVYGLLVIHNYDY